MKRRAIQIRTRLFPVVTSLCLYTILATAPAQAHHAFAAQYDANRPVTIHGTVSKVEWINPHTWIQVDLKQNDGNVEQWRVEAGSPAVLTSRGLTRDFLKLGTEVTISGYQAKDGSRSVNGRDLAVSNSPPIFIGSTVIGAPYDDGTLPQDEKKTVRTQVSGAWWMNTTIVQRLGITDDQKAKIERTFENHRQSIMSTTAQLEKEEAGLARLLDTETVDRNAVLSQIDRVTQARSEMERVAAVMTLEMREYLSRAQWEQLPRTTVTIGATGVAVGPGRGSPAQAVPGRRGNQ
jgi:Spy/CpxP family protein refolding chaperone